MDLTIKDAYAEDKRDLFILYFAPQVEYDLYVENLEKGETKLEHDEYANLQIRIILTGIAAAKKKKHDLLGTEKFSAF